MNKKKFINELESRLTHLDKNELDTVINYYSELIDDKLEDNITEVKAVKSLGNIDDIINEINAERIIEEKPSVSFEVSKEKKDKNLFLILLVICTFPIWITILSLLFGLFITIITVVGSLYLVVFSLLFSAIIIFVSSFVFLFSFPLTSLFTIGTSLWLAGLSILSFNLMNVLTKYTFDFIKKVFNFIKVKFKEVF